MAFNTSTQLPLKLNATNYTAWAFQFRTLLAGYDFFGFLDGSRPCPPSQIPADTSSSTTANPAYAHWVRQDQLLLSAIVWSIDPTLIPFIAASATSKEAWDTLVRMYGQPSRGKILALKNRLLNPQKGSRSISEFMLDIKAIVNDLALLGVPTDPEDLSLKILNGLDDSYKDLASAIHARDTPMHFDELLDKLLSTEARLASQLPSAPAQPVTAFQATYQQQRSTTGAPRQKQQKSSSSSSQAPRPSHPQSSNS